jgi:hypothetical protein
MTLLALQQLEAVLRDHPVLWAAVRKDQTHLTVLQQAASRSHVALTTLDTRHRLTQERLAEAVALLQDIVASWPSGHVHIARAQHYLQDQQHPTPEETP